jgi:uncharacterized membrane protein YfcA
MMPLLITALVGGILGGCTLLKTPQMTFLRLVPWLILLSTLIFMMGGRVTGWVTKPHYQARAPRILDLTWRHLPAVCLVLHRVFRRAAGILILAMLALLGHGRDPYHERAKGVAHDYL